MLGLLLAVAVDAQQVCAKYRDYVPPPAAVAAERECGEGCERDLAEKFANGVGVARNYDVAEYFLCRAGESMALMELEGMLGHVQRMRSGEETADLSFCDYVTSGVGSAECANARFDREMPKLSARADALRSHVRAQTLFDTLRTKGEAYADAESERIGEQSRGGTGYAGYSLEAQLDQHERLVTSLERWSKERAPAASADDAKAADNELNAAYRAAQKNIDEGGEELASWRTYLRDAQRAWIAYRDAFAAFYAEQWRGKAVPEALAREIVAQLTRERAAELGEDE